MFFLQRNKSPLFYISPLSSLSVIHLSVDKLKFTRKKKSGFCVTFFLSKSANGRAIYHQNAPVLK